MARWRFEHLQGQGIRQRTWVNGIRGVDVDAEQINLKGAASPAYGVSRAIGSIPILGALLTGSRKEGVFAANYRVTGSLDDPDFEINAALRPGTRYSP